MTNIDTFVPNTYYRKFIPQDFQLTGDTKGVLAWVRKYNTTQKVFTIVDVDDEEIYLGGKECSLTFTINPVECRAELLFEDIWDDAPGHPVLTMVEEMIESGEFLGTMVGCYIESTSESLLSATPNIEPILLINNVRYDPLMLIVDKNTSAESILKALAGSAVPEGPRE